SLHLFEAVLVNDRATLPVLATVDRNDDLTAAKVPERFGSRVNTRKPEPQHIDGHWKLRDRQPRILPNDRPPSVARDCQVGADLDWIPRSLGGDAGDAIALPQQAGCFGAHLKPKARVPLGLVRQEVQEIPLRHEDDVLASGW